MKFGVEEILMVVIAFLIGWFLKTMMTSRLIEGGGNAFSGGPEFKWPVCHSDAKGYGTNAGGGPCSSTRRLEGQECQNDEWQEGGEIPCQDGTKCNHYDVQVRMWESGVKHPSSWSPSGNILGTCQTK
jgi:hypothetical protein